MVENSRQDHTEDAKTSAKSPGTTRGGEGSRQTTEQSGQFSRQNLVLLLVAVGCSLAGLAVGRIGTDETRAREIAALRAQLAAEQQGLAAARSDIQRLYLKIKDGTSWQWAKEVNAPRSVHHSGDGFFSNPEMVERIQLLEDLSQDHGLQLDEVHLFAAAKLYFFSPDYKNFDQSRQLIDEYVAAVRRDGGEPSVDALFVQAVVHERLNLPAYDKKGDLACGPRADVNHKELKLVESNYRAVIEDPEGTYFVGASNNLAELLMCIFPDVREKLQEAKDLAEESRKKSPVDFAVLDTLAEAELMLDDAHESIALSAEALQSCQKHKSACKGALPTLQARALARLERALDVRSEKGSCRWPEEFQKLLSAVEYSEGAREKASQLKSEFIKGCG